MEMFAVVFDEGDVHDVYAPFTALEAATAWADINGGKVRLLKSPTPIQNRVRIAATVVTVGC
jgi:hypothetical protein